VLLLLLLLLLLTSSACCPHLASTVSPVAVDCCLPCCALLARATTHTRLLRDARAGATARVCIVSWLRRRRVAVRLCVGVHGVEQGVWHSATRPLRR
jgi:hypothetical protein